MAFKDKEQVMAITASLFIAFILWLYVMGEKNPVQTKVIQNIEVNLTNIENIEESNLALLPNQSFTVDLTVTGRALDVFNVKPEDFRIEADMGGYLKKGDNNIPIEVKSAPKGVQVVNKNGYTYVKVKLDQLVEKSVSINISITGNTKAGYGYVQPVIRPTEALVSGAAAYVNSVASAFGQIDLNSSETDITSSIPIKALDNEGKVVQNITIEPKYIDVFIPIKPSKTVPVIVKTKGSLAKNKILKYAKPKLNTIMILGDTNLLNKINAISTIEFDLSDIKESATKDVPLSIPKGIETYAGTKSINVDFAVENKVENTINIPITFENKNDNYNYNTEKDYVTITIEGAESRINEINQNDISAFIDLKDLSEGTYQLPIKLQLPSDVEIKSQSFEKISVSVQKK
ncbi:YbbR domain-containing protein [Caloramator quimbayensis]|uniref:YbbR domain-containing protein n=1 Tax=Caloramator quimbayensis TaxID=1147123 RepID=A0A1T4WPY2_9CLOT|nr:CdaR family protein [Caloramator quimbayensis]SKA79403.1 YbbR domain-containing protein [Caloramator quimbayensis]